MALEDLIGQERLQRISGKPFGINPDMTYERKEFVKRAGELFNVEEYYSRLKENSEDKDALKDLVGLAVDYMAGEKQENSAQLFENPHLAIEQGNLLLSKGYLTMAKFVENKREEILDKLTAENLYSLFTRVPLYKTGNPEYDRIRNLRKKIMEMQETAQKGGDLGSVVEEEVKELIESAPEEQKAYIARNQHLVIPTLTKSVIRSLQESFAYLFRDKKGNLDKEAIKNYLLANYKVVEDFIDDVPDEEKLGYWDDNLKPQYVELAKELYQTEKPKQKREDNKDKEERKDRAKELGIRT